MKLLTAIFTRALLCSIFGFVAFPSVGQTVASLWADYSANRYNHSNIPNNSYAGYGTGIVSIPTPSYTVYNVTSAPYNAIVNDAIDDQPAIQAAIDAAGAAGSGIVFLPAGTYYLNKPLYIKYNNVIVRGEGSTGGTATILDFRFSMYSMFKTDIDAGAVGAGGLWWGTGLVWIGPGNSFKANGAPNMITDYEHWRTTTTLATITAVSNPGSFTITVDNAASLSVGMKVLLRYVMPNATTRTLIKHIHGHAATEAGIDNNTYVGDCTNISSPGEQYYYWPASIQSISGNTVTFDRPLRIKVDPALWVATLRNIDGLITESGIEDVQILGHNISSMGHLVTPTSNATGGGTSLGGWNGLYINRSWNCWADNIRFVNLECGAIFSAAKNCSVLNTYVTSTTAARWYHHPFALRVYSSDNLVENFTIDGPSKVYHGINAEWYSSGNVYSKGLMKVGTFDSHRGSAFDQIRTEITVANDGGSAPGGAATSGPFAGKRFAHWNITQQLQAGYTYQDGSSNNGDNVYEPRQFPMGALVAITGTRDGSNGEYVPPGDLGAIEVAGTIADASLVNLYRAQLALRLSSLPIHIVDFDVRKTTGSQARISWTVAEPTNDDKFVVQWSDDGVHFKDLASVNASATNTKYSYDHNITDWRNTQFYRIQVTSDAGRVFYSSIKNIKGVSQRQLFSLYPNPVADKLIIAFTNSRVTDIRYVSIINTTGQVIKYVNPVPISSSQQLVIDLGDLPSGSYYIEAILNNRSYKKTFIKK